MRWGHERVPPIPHRKPSQGSFSDETQLPPPNHPRFPISHTCAHPKNPRNLFRRVRRVSEAPYMDTLYQSPLKKNKNFFFDYVSTEGGGKRRYSRPSPLYNPAPTQPPPPSTNKTILFSGIQPMASGWMGPPGAAEQGTESSSLIWRGRGRCRSCREILRWKGVQRMHQIPNRMI